MYISAALHGRVHWPVFLDIAGERAFTYIVNNLHT